jgi:glycosyltransferase involved in cell wall biosynthesis
MGYPVFRGPSPVQAAAEVLQRFRPSVVVVTSGSYAALSRAFLHGGVPIIVYLRDVEVPNMGGCLPVGERVRYVSNSRFNATRLAAAAGVEPAIIPPLVRPDRVRTATTRSRVLFVNPVPEKGVDLAFALAAARPDIPFDFFECWPLGEPVRERLLTRVRRLPNITFHRPQLDPSRLYRHAKIVLVPSVWEESWGRVVTEAHCNGIPALASDRGRLPESVGPGGVLVKPDASIEQWRAALSSMWDDRALYDALAASARRHAQRPEIQPAVLADLFVAFLTAHVARCASPRRAPTAAVPFASSAPDPAPF